MSSTRTLLLSAVTASLGLAFTLAPATSNATGTDSVVHPNSACKWATDWYVQYPEDEMANYFPSGWFNQEEGSDRIVVCGVDRFNITNTTGLRDLDVRLKSSADQAELVSCTAESIRPDGSLVKSVAIHAMVPAGATHRVDFNGALDQSVAYGAYVVSCALPRFMTLINILQREY